MAELGCTGLYWAILGCTELCLAATARDGVMGLTGATVVTGLTGITWVMRVTWASKKGDGRGEEEGKCGMTTIKDRGTQPIMDAGMLR